MAPTLRVTSRPWSLIFLLMVSLTSIRSVAEDMTVTNNRFNWALAAGTMGQEPGGSSSVTLLLSPSALNVFNFGPYAFKVEYPPGTSFSGVYMTVTAVQVSQSEFAKRVAGSRFANAICVVYDAANGDCVDFKVTCSNTSHQAIHCPTTSASYISVWSSFETTQSVINPGFLYAPIGTDIWANNLDSYFMLRIDPTVHGHTKGFSEFVAVSLGVTNPEGLGEFTFNAPLRPTDPRIFPPGSTIPISFSLSSVAHCGQHVTDATASLSVVQIADAQGHETSHIVFAQQNVFKYVSGNYEFSLATSSFPAGTYIITVYGNAFVSQATYFTLQ